MKMDIYHHVFSPIEVNTYIISDTTGECAIIDCGCYDQYEFEKLAQSLKKRNLSPVLLLNTHCHLDHIFGNRYVLEKYNLRTMCCDLEEPNRINAPQHAMFYGMTMEPSPEPAGFLSHGETVAFGNTVLRALHVPGHTAGSLAFYSESGKCVFTGDALFRGSIGRTDLPGGDFDTLIKSIRENLFSLPDDTKVWPGHGSPTTIGLERSSNPWLSS
jgi:glyoxylase-like metal-dependent hydrolase (beta-lactamase superfamily II)